MKNITTLVLLCFTLCFTSCFEDQDDVIATSSSVNDFVWRGMNTFYLYKSQIPDLADDRFPSTSSNAYFDYLDSFETPRDLFNSLIFDRQNVDRFSWIVDDFFELEQNFSGTSLTSGMEIYRAFAPNSSSQVIGVVRLVLPNSDADVKGLKRGDIFNAINGIPLTETNIAELLGPESITLSMARLNTNNTPNDTSDDTIEATGETVQLNKTAFTENPIFNSNVFQIGGKNIGYLMYNGFTRGSENQLNTVFADFRANNVEDLILDLRYNPGGSIASATALASMITGQFTGSVFERLVFNETQQQSNSNFNYIDRLPNNSPISSLNLNNITVLATGLSASASEGLINGLRPYINVNHIGSRTNGKTQASRTLYDSPDFSRNNVNPNHTYAMQPIIANGVNSNNEGVPANGLPADITLIENVFNLGVLGDVNEPMLALALQGLTSTSLKSAKTNTAKRTTALAPPLINDSDFRPFEGGMFID